ncbi:hypothetical protein [Caballeronia sp. ATUFL_M1_KS5A]|uniref:hypothetical protein n=1 Tax=Caballeronia sp. ATUFL_M1_KS5A TaxID=2921778 RepID=UPI0020291739|nr:hypothetical protein [Caballeronia sp. ATUFL_M1_KS5A]
MAPPFDNRDHEIWKKSWIHFPVAVDFHDHIRVIGNRCFLPGHYDATDALLLIALDSHAGGGGAMLAHEITAAHRTAIIHNVNL